jgi:hypothetical protein
LLARSFNIGLGMTDKALANYGVTIHSGLDEVESKAVEFRRVAGKYLG